jgi:acetylornithine/succinyldiaminopimelate/putrescine aminotransferase
MTLIDSKAASHYSFFMTFIQDQWQSGVGNASSLHKQHINPQMGEVLRIIGFDKTYVKAQGCSLWDRDGKEYLDFLGGYSVFSLGHNNPELIETLKDTLGSQWPNLVQMDSPPLSGVLAKKLCDRSFAIRLFRKFRCGSRGVRN